MFVRKLNWKMLKINYYYILADGQQSAGTSEAYRQDVTRLSAGKMLKSQHCIHLFQFLPVPTDGTSTRKRVWDAGPDQQPHTALV